MKKGGYTYILANRRNGTLYTGVTNDLLRRGWQHKDKQTEGFTKKYGISILVWFEVHDSIEEAIYREKQIKNWPRAWKLDFIEASNPEWKDLYGLLL